MGRRQKIRLIRLICLLFLFAYSCVAMSQPCYQTPEQAYRYLVSQQQDNLININTAGVAELITLKGVGHKTAESIVKYRQQNGQFSSVDELTKVSGIGLATLNNNRHRLVVADIKPNTNKRQ